MDLKEIIQKALTDSIPISEYNQILADFGQEGKTSGEQKEDLIYYTKLNAQRSKRLYKSVEISEDLATKVKSLQGQQWLLISETWCGDAANSIPVFGLLAHLNPKIEIRVVFRDEQHDLMNQFLTKGGKSIPKLIGLDQDLNVTFDWGPRPEEAQELYWGWRESEDRIPYSEFHLVMQKWYLKDKTASIQKELLAKLNG